MEPNSSNPIAEAIEWVCDQVKDSSFLLSVWLCIVALGFAVFQVIDLVVWLVR